VILGLCCSLDCNCMLGVHCLSGFGHEASNSVILQRVSEPHGCHMQERKEYKYVIDWQCRYFQVFLHIVIIK